MNFVDIFLNILLYENFMKIHPVGAEFPMQTDEERERHDEE